MFLAFRQESHHYSTLCWIIILVFSPKRFLTLRSSPQRRRRFVGMISSMFVLPNVPTWYHLISFWFHCVPNKLQLFPTTLDRVPSLSVFLFFFRWSSCRNRWRWPNSNLSGRSLKPPRQWRENELFFAWLVWSDQGMLTCFFVVLISGYLQMTIKNKLLFTYIIICSLIKSNIFRTIQTI